MSDKLLSFGDAIAALKAGKKVCREGWNGKNMYLIIVKGYFVVDAINGYFADILEKRTQVQDAIYMFTAQQTLVPWLASQSDVLAEDWEIIK